jgi:hypothetical protein
VQRESKRGSSQNKRTTNGKKKRTTNGKKTKEPPMAKTRHYPASMTSPRKEKSTQEAGKTKKDKTNMSRTSTPFLTRGFSCLSTHPVDIRIVSVITDKYPV